MLRFLKVHTGLGKPWLVFKRLFYAGICKNTGFAELPPPPTPTPICFRIATLKK